MTPILFDSVAYDYSSNGIGPLSEATKCTAHEVLNGVDEIEFVYPITGRHYSSIEQRKIVLAKPNPADDPQPFRIYRISRPLNGMVTVNARHLAYDLSGAVVRPYTAQSAAGAISGLATHAIGVDPFTFWTNVSVSANFAVVSPTALRSVLGGTEGSILDTFGGEYQWDKTTVKLYAHRGADRGVSITYGKNLTDINQEENCAECYTAVFPFWLGNDGTLVSLDNPVPVSGTFNYQKILTVDFSTDFETTPTTQQLTQAAQEYISKNNVGVPKVSLSVSFVQLEQTEEYKSRPWAEQVLLGDTVEVVFESLGVNSKARVVEATYDVLQDRYEGIVIGDARANIADTIAKQQADIKEAPKKAVSFFDAAIAAATQLITGNMGGHVILHRDPSTGKPFELLIMDTEDIATATKIWRFNLSGLGYSGTGYDGPYTTAITMDGTIVANFIKAGLLMGVEFKTEAQESASGTTELWRGVDIDSGKISFYWYKKVNGEITERGTFGDIAAAANDEDISLNILTEGPSNDIIIYAGSDVAIDASASESSGSVNIGRKDPGTNKSCSVNIGGNGLLKLFAKASRTGSSYSAGSSGQVLHSGGANGSVYWQNERTFPYLGTIVVGNPSGDSSYATAFVPETLWGSGMRFELGSGNSYTQFYVDAYGIANKASGSPGNLYGYYIVSADGVEV